MNSPEISRNTFTCVTWCQPADVNDEDVILLDGVVVDVADESVRSALVVEINKFAKPGNRRPAPDGGWVVRTGGWVVMEVPVVSGLPGVESTVAVLARRTDGFSTDRVVDQIAKTAELAGYSVDRQVVQRVLSYGYELPKGRLARIWGWIRGPLVLIWGWIRGPFQSKGAG